VPTSSEGSGNHRRQADGPFDITRYTQAVATLGDTTKQVQTLVGTLEHDASGATRRADDVRG
jgi:hypothetical protein